MTLSATPLDGALRDGLARIARVPQLLVACDYDGTLAPIVENPSDATPLPEAVAALRALASLPQTKVAVISGRALRDLAVLSRLPSEIHLVGSHGSEFDTGFVQQLDPEQTALRTRLQEELRTLVAEHPGATLESKPASVAVHTRRADRDVAARIVDRVERGPVRWPGVHVTRGKEVVELSVVQADKGTALDTLRGRLGASAVLFVGDDVTDENGFARLRGTDIGVKVGSGDTLATHRVPEPVDVATMLAQVLDVRRRWLYGERAVPIERHSMLACGDTVALVTPDATVTWLCHPRPDSSAIFADLLGGAAAGYFSVLPDRAGIPLGQRYRTGGMAVQTRWSGLTVTDWLDPAGPAGQTVLVRQLTGTARSRVTFKPRPEFGRVPVRLQPFHGGLLVLGGPEPTVLYSPGVEWDVVSEGGYDTGHAVVDLATAGGSALLELRCGTDDQDADLGDVAQRAAAALDDSRAWLAGLTLPRRSTELVARSALTLRGLVHRPTGAILAAATGGLPEDPGGVRNWDYRYCWLRDAAMTANVLVELGSMAEADALLAWIAGCVERTGGHPERLHPLYTVEGHPLGPETILDSLPGYAGSRPVRVGNAANRQLQLDVFGQVADLVAAVADRRGSITGFEGDVIRAMVDAVSRRWFEPDHGIWEQRQPPRHHVYSKVMCWQTVDRALRLAERHGLAGDAAGWAALRDRIAENVLEHGWNDDVGAYTTAYDGVDLDAASLWVGLSGLLPDDDPRFLSTVLAIEAELRSGPVVYRYLSDDGMPGTEGGFHLCTAWMVESYLRTGRRADAEELYDQLAGRAGPTGLLPEQYDPLSERGLGNHPQAYSHLGLIRCARLLDSQ
ncbi:MAG: trehalose-phosphatase [Actinocatenispora sp.]